MSWQERQQEAEAMQHFVSFIIGAGFSAFVILAIMFTRGCFNGCN